MSDNRIPFTIKVQPWFQDHSVGGRIVLPAVETMLLLASRCLALHPKVDVRVMENVRFGKLLEIPANAVNIATLVECAAQSDGQVHAKLLSRIQMGAMSRIKEHGEIFFSYPQETKEQSPTLDPAPLTGGTLKKIDSERLYQELVPFGPRYRTLQETLYLSNYHAWGRLKAPEVPFIDPIQSVLGSPFPLDGAMHAACVLGQQFVGYPPFPVGFSKRHIIQPTQPGSRYITKVAMTSRTPDELVFDLAIFDSEGQVYETVTGIRMRDVRKAMKKQVPIE